MIDPVVARALEAAVPTIVVSTGSWGVRECHWLPDLDGRPAIWLTTSTERERRTIERSTWLSAQVTMLLMRQGVPYDATRRLRVFVQSAEGQRQLLDEAW